MNLGARNIHPVLYAPVNGSVCAIDLDGEPVEILDLGEAITRFHRHAERAASWRDRGDERGAELPQAIADELQAAIEQVKP